MISEELQEQASLYVLGALEHDEASAFEAQLASNPELRRYVDELFETAAQLAHAAPPRALPPHLEARVLAEIRATHMSPVLPATTRPTWIPWAIAAGLAVACVLALADRQRLSNLLAAVREENAASHSQMADAQSRIDALAAEKRRAEQQIVELQQREADARAQMVTLAEARDDAANKLAQLEQREKQEDRREEREQREARDTLAKIQVATLSSKLATAPDASASIVWDEEQQRGVLNAVNVPPNSADRDYQLWITDPQHSQPVSAGVFHIDSPGSKRIVFTPTSRITSATAFLVSLERRGGVPKAEGPIVLAGK